MFRYFRYELWNKNNVIRWKKGALKSSTWVFSACVIKNKNQTFAEAETLSRQSYQHILSFERSKQTDADIQLFYIVLDSWNQKWKNN